MSSVIDVFYACADAIISGKLITRESKRDKEFHFQDWFGRRLDELSINYDVAGRNTYPDYPLVMKPEGYEIKGLAYPGRLADYDANSQMPTGLHNGRRIFYVFGRYPVTDENKYAVHDLVICDGDFLNAEHNYVHKNKHVKGFGTYGDIKIRDRKMYVAPTPFGLVDNLERQFTLILPESDKVDDRLQAKGELVRTEAQHLVVGYNFNLQTNEIQSDTIPNPNAGKEHKFLAYRIQGDRSPSVKMK